MKFKIKKMLHLPFKPFLKPYRDMEKNRLAIEEEYKNKYVLMPSNLEVKDIKDYDKLKERYDELKNGQ